MQQIRIAKGRRMGLNTLDFRATFVETADRRSNRRFPVHEGVSYKLLDERRSIVGTGETVNLGSGGVAFTTTRRLPINAPVEIYINWPARLNGTCSLKLVVTGRVIRSEEGNAVVQIERHVFRTCATPVRAQSPLQTAIVGVLGPDEAGLQRAMAAR
jgi:hypothetical protein